MGAIMLGAALLLAASTGPAVDWPIPLGSTIEDARRAGTITSCSGPDIRGFQHCKDPRHDANPDGHISSALTFHFGRLTSYYYHLEPLPAPTRQASATTSYENFRRSMDAKYGSGNICEKAGSGSDTPRFVTYCLSNGTVSLGLLHSPVPRVWISVKSLDHDG